MELSLEALSLLFFIAIVAGFIDAIAGGGGMLTVPALLSVGLPPTQALATNKLQSTFSSFSATWYFFRAGLLPIKSMIIAVVCTFVGAGLGALLVQRVHATLLIQIIPILLIIIALYFLFLPNVREQNGQPRLSDALFALCFGGGIGFYDGFFGPGTGSLFTLAFVMVGQLRLVEATARTKLLNFTSNFAALLFFILAGLPVWKAGFVMAAGGIVGARIGAKMAVLKGQQWIRPMVVTVSLIMALKLLLEAYVL
jgi:hypothetical protein